MSFLPDFAVFVLSRATDAEDPISPNAEGTEAQPPSELSAGRDDEGSLVNCTTADDNARWPIPQDPDSDTGNVCGGTTSLIVDFNLVINSLTSIATTLPTWPSRASIVAFTKLDIYRHTNLGIDDYTNVCQSHNSSTCYTCETHDSLNITHPPYVTTSLPIKHQQQLQLLFSATQQTKPHDVCW